MDATVVFFSQTGNTAKAAEAVAKGLSARGVDAVTTTLERAEAADVARTGLLGVGAPSFASQAPTPVKEFLRSLPDLPGTPAFVFSTTGGAPGRVLYDMTRELRKKGAAVVGGLMIRGEVFHPVPCLNGRFPGRPDVDDLIQAEQFGEAVAEHVLAKHSGPVPGTRKDALRGGWGFYDFGALTTTDTSVRLVMPEPKLDAEACNDCGLCAKWCPTDNIILDPKPVLGRKCIRCYRCLNDCPQQAFSAKWWLSNVLLYSMYNPLFERWFGDVDPGEKVY